MQSPKKVLITGATGEVGSAVVAATAAAGHRVLAFGRKELGELPETWAKERVSYHRIDLGAENETEALLLQLFEQEGHIDAAFLLAGGFKEGSIHETLSKDIDEQVHINFRTTYHVLRPLFAHMCAQKGGDLCMIAGRGAILPSKGGFALGYTLAKGMLCTLAATLDVEGRAHGVRTKLLVPSIIDTPTNRRAMPEADPTTWVPIEEVAATLLWLIDAKSRSWSEVVVKLYNKS